MKEGKTLEALTQEVMRQATSRKDYLLSTHEIKLISGIQRAGSKEPALSVFGGAASGDASPRAELATPAGTFGVGEYGLEQLATQLGMPLRYLRKLQVHNPNLLDLNINTLLFQERKERLVRTLDGNARAILSHRYRRLDNDALLEALWPVFDDLGGLSVKSAEITEQRLFLKLVSPRLRGEVRVGDEVQFGLALSNSEVGCGAVSVELLIYRLVCTNGAIVGAKTGGTRRYHVGGAIRGGDGPGYQLVLDETSEAADVLFWDEVREAVRYALQEKHFQEALEQMKTAAGLKLESPPEQVADRLAGRYGLGEGERESVLTRLLESGDLTQWGLANAVTRMSQDIGSYERATSLERLGGTLLQLSPREWNVLSLN